MTEPTILCHTSWMPYYEARRPDLEALEDDEDTGGEVLNFLNQRGRVQGYVPSNNRTIRIEKLGADPAEDYIDGIQVIFTARNPETKERVVVGWYENARVYRHLQTSNLSLPHKPDTTAVYNIEAASSNVVRVPVEDRTIEVPSMTTGAPGINAVFYADDKAEFAPVLEKIEEFIFAYEGGDWDEDDNGRKGKGGWPTDPDAAHNARVEAAAIAAVTDHYGELHADRQADNCGWDLEFMKNGERHCVEVKGVSADTPRCELSPNEYWAMQSAMAGEFEGGQYRLAVVTLALSQDPKVHVFRWRDQDGVFACELTGEEMSVTERTSASLG